MTVYMCSMSADYVLCKLELFVIMSLLRVLMEWVGCIVVQEDRRNNGRAWVNPAVRDGMHHLNM